MAVCGFRQCRDTFLRRFQYVMVLCLGHHNTRHICYSKLYRSCALATASPRISPVGGIDCSPTHCSSVLLQLFAHSTAMCSSLSSPSPLLVPGSPSVCPRVPNPTAGKGCPQGNHLGPRPVITTHGPCPGGPLHSGGRAEGSR